MIDFIHRLNRFSEQETVIPLLITDPPRDMIAQSQSSTGKTAAIVIAMLNRVDVTKKHPQALFFSPTYETGHQMADIVERCGIEAGIRPLFADGYPMGKFKFRKPV